MAKPKRYYYQWWIPNEAWVVFDRDWTDDYPIAICHSKYTAEKIRDALNEQEEGKYGQQRPPESDHGNASKETQIRRTENYGNHEPIDGGS